MAVLEFIFLVSCAVVRADSGPAGWQKSFPAEQVGSHLSVPPLRMIVIAAGKEDGSEAAEALRSALRQSKKAALVMDQSILGDVGSLDDKGIVKAAQSLPIERIVVVRVFAGGPDVADSAVVTIYDKAGKTISAFTTEKGTPLPAAITSGGASGVSNEVASAVSEAMRTTPEQSDAQREWERNVIWFEDWTGINYNQLGAVVAHWSIPRRGIQRESLNDAKLYEALGRPDLATIYNRKRAIRIAVALTGGGMVLVGAASLIWGLVSGSGSMGGRSFSMLNGVDYQYAKSDTGTGFTPWILTGVFMGGGTVMVLVAAGINPNPVRPDEARQMVIDYDRKLRQRLGLPELKGVSQREAPRGISNFALAPAISPNGAGLAAAFNF